jgi:hypothetical protein
VTKKEAAIRRTIYLAGVKPYYRVRVGFDEIHVDTMKTGNAIVRALREVARTLDLVRYVR